MVSREWCIENHQYLASQGECCLPMNATNPHYHFYEIHVLFNLLHYSFMSTFVHAHTCTMFEMHVSAERLHRSIIVSEDERILN